ncbi:RNase adapter RapZ [Nonomuraea monospora]|uniref:RNase adapter RapZ n=1 Tax=Nonomuraea monospora TaxID=568818 RepID=A0ABN3CR19_9ACTN
MISFGYLHQPTKPDGPEADRIEDVRERLRDPAVAKEILDLDGLHPRVQDIILNTPGAPEPIDNLVAYALVPTGPKVIALGCAGGKHRAAGLVELTARRVPGRGREVEAEHLHVHLPRVLGRASS